MSGSRYSLGGYKIAVQTRSSKTLLVEGPSDKAVLNRIICERGVSEQPIVDVVDIVKDDVLSGWGSKCKIDYIRTRLAISHLEDKLGTLVDREWEGLADEEKRLQTDWIPPSRHCNHFITMGHSIENYNFDVTCVLGYLKFAIHNDYSMEIERIIKVRFENILALASVFSLEAFRRSMIDRCKNSVKVDHIIFSDNICYLADGLNAALAERNVDNITSFVSNINQDLNQFKGSKLFEHKRWLIHGHLGENLIWAAVAKTICDLGVAQSAVNIIARSTCRERDNYWRDWLSKLNRENREPLDSAIDWLIN